MAAVYMGGRIPQIWLNVSKNLSFFFLLFFQYKTNIFFSSFTRSKEEVWR